MDSTPYPTHSYATDGTFTVSLTTTNCDLQGVYTSFTDTIIHFCTHDPSVYTTHPWLCINDTLWTAAADSYQWFSYGDSLPETNQYLADYARYANSGFSVITTLNGCSERSKSYSESPQWSGYYFDGIGDPCVGDTVVFAVLHINGFLSGSETILWYRNDTLLPGMTNEDTLLIYSSGKFECKVVNPDADCPQDTTSSFLQYNCSVIGVDEMDENEGLSVFPNPATEKIIIEIKSVSGEGAIEVYNNLGVLIKLYKIYSSGVIDVADLPPGLYFIRMKNSRISPVRFIKQ
jgi:hypothetical protein